MLDPRFFTRALPRGIAGIGDAWVDRWWDCERPDELVARISAAGLELPFSRTATALYSLIDRWDWGPKADQVMSHYDLGNDLFEAMLGPTMAYSCGYWNGASRLDEAQTRKFDLVCRKVGLRPGMKVLDIGCGWGTFAKFAAETYGVSVTGATISGQQAEFARTLCRGLPVDIQLKDYRDVSGRFDAVVSIGMFEHVGYKNYRRFLEIASARLEPEALLLVHTIGVPVSTRAGNPWITKNIYAGMLPSIQQIAAAAEGLFLIEDVHNFGFDYYKTLLEWWKNFEEAWPAMAQKYGDRVYRLWKFYILSFAGMFKCRHNQLWQIVFSQRGVPGGYVSVR